MYQRRTSVLAIVHIAVVLLASDLAKSSLHDAGPSPIVAYRLCGPGKESGEALLKRFKDIRRTLEQGTCLHNAKWI